MSRNSHRTSARLAGLDGLRAVGCLMVFAVHFGQITGLQGEWGPFDLKRLLENGNTGVALFFSLSGFLLSLPYWKALDSGVHYPGFGGYLVRRAARIVPAYFACLTLLLITNKFWLKADWVRDALLHYTFTFNLFGDTIFRINPPFWTLAVEIQFYLLLPLFFLLARSLSLRAAIALMLALGVAAYAAHFAIMTAATSALVLEGAAPAGKGVSHVLTYSLVAHLPHFLLGVVTGAVFLALRHEEAGGGGGRRELVFWAAVFALLVILGTPTGDLFEIPYGRYNLPYVPLLLCLLILLAPRTVSGRVLLDSFPLRAVGAVSYGVYIYHLPVLNVVKRVWGKLGWSPIEHWLGYGMLSLTLTLAVAALSYRLLERPVLARFKARELLAGAPRPTRTGAELAQERSAEVR